jgi:hypothetical protein
MAMPLERRHDHERRMEEEGRGAREGEGEERPLRLAGRADASWSPGLLEGAGTSTRLAIQTRKRGLQWRK